MFSSNDVTQATGLGAIQEDNQDRLSTRFSEVSARSFGTSVLEEPNTEELLNVNEYKPVEEDILDGNNQRDTVHEVYASNTTELSELNPLVKQ